MLRFSCRIFLLLFIFYVLLASSVVALPNIALRGRVLDASGAVIPGARVYVYSAAGVPVASTAANAEGKFILEPLSPGRYEVVARQPGLEAASRAVDATGGDPGEIVLTLRLGVVASSVTVTARKTLEALK